MQDAKKCIVVGAGFGGLAAAILLADKGYAVTVLEKNEQAGGRAGVFEEEGLRFDMGPSWYLMPEVFEKFYRAIGEDIHDHLDLVRLSPSYRVYFEGEKAPIDIHSNVQKDTKVFESLQPGAGEQLTRYLSRAAEQYELIRDNFLNANLRSWRTYCSRAGIRALRKVPLFGSMQNYVSRYFSDYRLQQLMQYTLVFLGSSPYNAPALYNIMSHLDFAQGVYYPKKGMYEIVKSLEKIARKRGVNFKYNSAVTEIITDRAWAKSVRLEDGGELAADVVVVNADMQHTETHLLQSKSRQYRQSYWEDRTMSPSALLLYLGVEGELPMLLHHTLYFSANWQKNFAEIFDQPTWPSNPSLYISNPSKTDKTVTKKGVENIFVLVPLGAGIEDSEIQRKEYTNKILEKLEEILHVPDLRQRIVYQRVFGPNDFISRYNSYKGSALGLAHTLRQSAFARPSFRSKKVKNLYYVGAGVHPGIGMPVCLVSAQIAVDSIYKNH